MRSLIRAVAVLLAFGALAVLSSGPAQTVQGASISWLVTTTPSEPYPGAIIHVQATATADALAGIPQFTIYLDEQQPAVTQLDSPQTINAQTLPATVGWDLSALRAGTQTFHIFVSFETQNCPVPQPGCYFYFDSAISPTYTINVMSPPVGGVSIDAVSPTRSGASSGLGLGLLGAAVATALGAAGALVARRLR